MEGVPEATPPVREPAPSGAAGVRPSQLENLLMAGGGLFDDRPPYSRHRWEPLPVEEVRASLPQYEITGLVSRGGMGAVYRGTQRALRREVAVKILPPEMRDDAGDMQFVERFKQEAQAMARLSHPNIVAVFDAGETDGGLLYFVMEHVEGEDLAQLLAREGALPPRRASEIALAVCAALAFAHEEGIVHRDIKPSNIMIDRRGRVKVADFGLAKAVETESTVMTRSDVAMGSPDFAAPELRMPGMKVDARADIYALGVVLYQMLTGVIPRGRFQPPGGLVAGLDKGFDAIVDKAMQADRDMRYATAGEIKAALLAVAAGNSHRPGGEAGTGMPRRIRLLAAAVMICLAIFGGLMVLKQTGRNSQTPGQSVSGDPANGNPVPAVNGLTDPAAGLLLSAQKPLSVARHWTDATDFVRAEGLKHGGMKLDGEWLRPTRQGIWVSLSGAPLPPNVAIRVRFACRVELNMRMTEGSGGGYYSLGVGGPFQYISRTIDGDRTDTVPPRVLDSGFADGSEHELIATTHGDRLHLILDGKLHLAATDPTFPKGSAMLALYDDGPGKIARVRQVEWMNLDGLSEFEALDAVGVRFPSDDPTGSDGRVRFPVGIWSPLHDRDKDAREITSNPKNKTDGPWMLLEDVSYGWYEHEIVPMMNVGLRAQFRGLRVNEGRFPQMNLRGLNGGQPSVNLHIHNGKLQIRSTRTGYPVLAEATLREPLVTGQEYTMEFYAIGRELIARVNGQMLVAESDMRPVPGNTTIFGSNMDWFKDVEVINLDGLAEAEARKVAGL